MEGKPDEAGQAGPVKGTSCVRDTLNVVRLSAGPTGARSNLHALPDMTWVDSVPECGRNAGKAGPIQGDENAVSRFVKEFGLQLIPRSI